MTRSKVLTFLAAAAAILLVPASAVTASPSATSSRQATVKVAHTDLGRTLVDSKGRTLYLFKHDSGTRSRCFGQCAVAWPPLRTSGKPTAGRGAHASLLGTTKRSDGRRQVTYKGHPLYRFQGDQKAGATNGQGINAFGGLWWAVSPSGKQITASVSTHGGGNGYNAP
jgi:predicted lipoprotein with Yx(FWY)xxD motif